MFRNQQLFHVRRLPHFLKGKPVGNVNKNVLKNQRLYYHESIKKAQRSGKYVLQTALVAGTVLVGGIFIKLHNKEVAEDEENEKYQQERAGDLQNCDDVKRLSLSEAIRQSRDLMQRKKDETGSPGLTIAVSVDGKTVWSEGIGYSDVENRLKCTPQSVFRIASISKSITMTAVAKLLESGDLDLDKPVQFYVPEFPEKTWKGKKVQITTRQLLSHLGGIRHYSKDYMKNKTETDNTDKAKDAKAPPNTSSDVEQQQANMDRRKQEQSKEEMQLDEYYITRHYSSVLESLEIFKDDPLVHKPESKYLYTTYGWTLVSAVVEKVAKMPFEKYLQETLDELGLENTYLDEHKPLIYNRGRHYVKNQKGRLENAPYVDLSYKWAGGGLVSNVTDVVKFGNAMLYSYQTRTSRTASQAPSSSSLTNSLSTAKTTRKESEQSAANSRHLRGYLKPDTMKMMWTPVVKPEPKWEGIANNGYGLGWSVCNRNSEHAFCKDQKFFVSHTGGAIGASSVLLILPTENSLSQIAKGETLESGQTDKDVRESTSLYSSPPKGVVVAIIVNMISVGLNKTAYDIARIFEQVDTKL
ncbi:serine beta-lactamase-like protein LACTB, mitochondrial [Mercenaria mercenaria]|uniref:serine beta-lactamase-like protein LACTB, mitochondrial n=1 Tax=Mercenaria mercenaria TaxID=6596 RepID=UPI001E1E1E3A|nr:serine beta-lactamase-like protein LACTB, mitochondrial [Mercenaria mercenaria]XP_045173568.1 serine beta-lactamase-like protein LACTB, mitochondrial [Mercenaria mercenaria]XP_045173570.1 serine beta-lactamase-like protein LACTB, mitochondrial [Mercenaria mercenaria]